MIEPKVLNEFRNFISNLKVYYYPLHKKKWKTKQNRLNNKPKVTKEN